MVRSVRTRMLFPCLIVVLLNSMLVLLSSKALLLSSKAVRLSSTFATVEICTLLLAFKSPWIKETRIETHPISQPNYVVYFQLDSNLNIRQVAEVLFKPFEHSHILLQQFKMLLSFILLDIVIQSFLGVANLGK